MSWQDDLQDWGNTQTAEPPSPAEVSAFVARARRHRQRAGARRVVLTAGLAMAALVLFWLTVPLETPTGWTWTPQAPVEVAVADAPLSPGVHALEDDRVTVAANSIVQAVSTGPTTRLVLEAGEVEAEVAPRGESESFSIDAGDYAVQVIGTRFSVQHSPFEVRVTEGVVSVVRGAQTWRVKAGEWFSRDTVHRPKIDKPAKKTPLADIQKLVLDKNYDDARPLLAAWTADTSDASEDVSAWRLLAQLETRAGNPVAAVTAWEHIIAHAPAADAQAARYEAARLLSDEPARVVALLDKFLEAPHSLSGEARLRLAEAHARLGNTERQLAVLEEAALLHAGTAVGAEALRRLGR